MKVLVFAYSDLGYEALKTLLDMGEQAVGVVTHADDPKEEHWFRSVEALARSNGLPVVLPDNPNTPEILAWASALKPDILFSIYYRKILKQPWLDLAPKGAFNLHGSLLPQFRGRCPANWALIEGAQETGVTLHVMVERPDAGDIVAQERFPILGEDTVREVNAKMLPAAQALLTRIMPLLRNNRAPRTPQLESAATTFGGRKPDDGVIDWNWPARKIHNWVRALTHPYPGAFTFVKGEKLFVWKGRVWTEPVIPTTVKPVPGLALKSTDDGVPIVTGDGVYLMQAVQWAGHDTEPAQKVVKEGPL